MSRKHTELEKAFIDELPQRTGRGLEAWMAAIAASGIADRNQIIDWLRPQGLTFAHASWLERIHHNGGRPIYQGPAVLAPAPSAKPVPQQDRPSTAPQPTPPSAKPYVAPPAARPGPAPRPADVTADLESVLAQAKGLRPLAELLIRELRGAIPSTVLSATAGLIVASAPRPFAAVLTGARDIRLGLVLTPGPTAPAMPGRLAGAPADLNHVVTLSDARLVDNRLIELIALANATANPT